MNLRKVLLLIVTSLIASPAFAAYPYDSACRIRVGSSGGSGTLIAVKEGKALVLTVKHVAERKGQAAVCTFENGVTVRGVVLATHRQADVALVLVDAPEGVVPVPVAAPSEASGPFVMAGYPGYDRNTLRWQQGKFEALDYNYLVISCRPEEGMSGGPTFDKYGRVVGAVSAYSDTSGYAGSGQAMIELVAEYVNFPEQPAPRRGLFQR